MFFMSECNDKFCKIKNFNVKLDFDENDFKKNYAQLLNSSRYDQKQSEFDKNYYLIDSKNIQCTLELKLKNQNH